MGTEWGKYGELRWVCEGWDGNAGAGNQCKNARNLSGNAKNMEHQGGVARDQGGDLNIALKMIQNSNGNDKFKE